MSVATRVKLTRAGSLPGSGDTVLVIAMLLCTNVILAAPKLMLSGISDGSPVGALIFGSIYVIAVARFFQSGSRARSLLRRSHVLLAFLALNLLSTLWSASIVVTFKQSIELLGTAAVGYYIVARFPLVKFLQALSRLFGIISALSLMLIVFSPARGRDYWGSGPFSGIYENKNALGAAMALAVVTLLPLIVERRRPNRGRLCLLFALCIYLLVGSNSMTALLICCGTCLAFTVASTCTSARYGRRARAASIAGAAAVAAAIAVFGINLEAIVSAVGRRVDLTGRIDFWPGVMQAISDRPILGWGYNAFFHSAGPYLDYLTDFIAQTGFTPSHAHNSFLQIALGTGLVGVGLFCIVLVVALRHTLALVNRRSILADAWPLCIVVFLILGSYSETYFAQFNTLEWILFVTAFLYPLREAGPDEAGDAGTTSSRNEDTMASVC